MQVALTGLSQSGKTTLFAAVTEGRTHSQAAAAHQVDKEVVKVPDERLGVLSEIYQPKKTTHATIEFLDLPGLSFTDEANRHVARRILAQARKADMLVLVLRAFESASVAAYRDRIDPKKDMDELASELMLADLESITNRIEKLEKSVKRPSKTQDLEKRELALLERCNEAIENEKPLNDVIASGEEEKMLRSFGFLTLKPRVIVLNVDEDKVNEKPMLDEGAFECPVMMLSAQIEAELASLEPEERGAFLQDIGLKDIAKDRLIRRCYEAMHLISFLTVGEDEVRAWTVPAGCEAVEAAGEIHSDIQRGFIRAETVSYEDFMAAGDMKAAKAAGKVRLEGKTYPVQDGDIINYRFNV